jgi:hypothetical protein
VLLFGQVAGLGQTARVQRGSSLSPLYPSGRELKGAVAGVLHRARSVSTGASTLGLPSFYLFSIWPVVT